MPCLSFSSLCLVLGYDFLLGRGVSLALTSVEWFIIILNSFRALVTNMLCRIALVTPVCKVTKDLLSTLLFLGFRPLSARL